MPIKHVPKSICEKYDVYDYRHAAAILKSEFPEEFHDLGEVLKEFRIREEQAKESGHVQGQRPRSLAQMFRAKGWQEKTINARTVLNQNEVISMDKHTISLLKNRIAVDLELNRTDFTCQSDPTALRAFFQFQMNSVVVLIAKSSLIRRSMGKLCGHVGIHGPRKTTGPKSSSAQSHNQIPFLALRGVRTGSCPVLGFGLKMNYAIRTRERELRVL